MAAATAIFTTGSSSIMQKFSTMVLKGVDLTGDIGYYTLLILTCMPILGQVGINQVAVGQTDMAFLKASSVAASYLLMIVFSPYLPVMIQGGWMFWLAGLGPWYFYDIIQIIMRPDFAANGFKPIVEIPGDVISSGGGKDPSGGAKWTLSATFLNVFFLALGASGQAIAALFPSSSGTQIGNAISYTGGGLLGVSMLGSLGVMLTSGGGLGAAAAAAETAAPAALLGGGGVLPPLSSFIDKSAQSGGGKDESLFLYSLGLIAFAGITLGLIRSKQ